MPSKKINIFEPVWVTPVQPKGSKDYLSGYLLSRSEYAMIQFFKENSSLVPKPLGLVAQPGAFIAAQDNELRDLWHITSKVLGRHDRVYSPYPGDGVGLSIMRRIVPYALRPEIKVRVTRALPLPLLELNR